MFARVFASLTDKWSEEASALETLAALESGRLRVQHGACFLKTMEEIQGLEKFPPGKIEKRMKEEKEKYASYYKENQYEEINLLTVEVQNQKDLLKKREEQFK